MINNKKATILIYVLILVSIVMTLAVIILNNSIKLENSLSYQTIEREFSSKIKEKWHMQASYDMYFNSEWSWFVDIISCPDNITMSWETIFSSWIATTWTTSWSTYICSWSYDSTPLIIYPNIEINNFSWASFNSETITFTDGGADLTWTFTSFDSWTYITIPKDSFQKPDWIDDDFNDDNYIATYDISENIRDNDDLWRITIVWNITNTWTLENIFWNNLTTNQYIQNNTNNINNSYINIWNVNSGSLYLNIDKDSTIKVIKFDRTKYTQNKELFAIEIFEWTISAWSWYIEKNWDVLNFNWSIWSSNYNFDFKNNDYAIFVKNNWTWVLNYKITWVDRSISKSIYISPVNDSLPKEIKVLAWHIIINAWIYIWKLAEYSIFK